MSLYDEMKDQCWVECGNGMSKLSHEKAMMILCDHIESLEKRVAELEGKQP